MRYVIQFIMQSILFGLVQSSDPLITADIKDIYCCKVKGR